jgi:mono/diheme cytochrome c family protein
VQKESDAPLTEIVNHGKGKMAAYKGKLTDEQIRDLISFVRTLKSSLAATSARRS